MEGRSDAGACSLDSREGGSDWASHRTHHPASVSLSVFIAASPLFKAFQRNQARCYATSLESSKLWRFDSFWVPSLSLALALPPPSFHPPHPPWPGTPHIPSNRSGTSPRWNSSHSSTDYNLAPTAGGSGFKEPIVRNTLGICGVWNGNSVIFKLVVLLPDCPPPQCW